MSDINRMRHDTQVTQNHTHTQINTHSHTHTNKLTHTNIYKISIGQFVICKRIKLLDISFTSFSELKLTKK